MANRSQNFSAGAYKPGELDEIKRQSTAPTSEGLDAAAYDFAEGETRRGLNSEHPLSVGGADIDLRDTVRGTEEKVAPKRTLITHKDAEGNVLGTVLNATGHYTPTYPQSAIDAAGPSEHTGTRHRQHVLDSLGAMGHTLEYKDVTLPSKGTYLGIKDIHDAHAAGHITDEEHEEYLNDWQKESSSRESKREEWNAAMRANLNEGRRRAEVVRSGGRLKNTSSNTEGGWSVGPDGQLVQRQIPAQFGVERSDAEKALETKRLEKKQKERDDANRGLLDSEGNALPPHEIEANAMAEFPKHPGNAPEHPGEDASPEALKAHAKALKAHGESVKTYNKTYKAWSKKWGSVLPHLDTSGNTDVEPLKVSVTGKSGKSELSGNPEDIEAALDKPVPSAEGEEPLTLQEKLQSEAVLSGVKGFAPISGLPRAEQAKGVAERIQVARNRSKRDEANAALEEKNRGRLRLSDINDALTSGNIDAETHEAYLSDYQKEETEQGKLVEANTRSGRNGRGRPAMPSRGQRATTIEEEHARLAHAQKQADAKAALKELNSSGSEDSGDAASEEEYSNKTIASKIAEIDEHKAWLNRHGTAKQVDKPSGDSEVQHSPHSMDAFERHVAAFKDEFPEAQGLTGDALKPHYDEYLKEHKKRKADIQQAQKTIKANAIRDKLTGRTGEADDKKPGDYYGAWRPGEKDRGGRTTEDLEKLSGSAIRQQDENAAKLIWHHIYAHRDGDPGQKTLSRGRVEDKNTGEKVAKDPFYPSTPGIVCLNTGCFNTLTNESEGNYCPTCQELPDTKPRVKFSSIHDEVASSLDQQRMNKFNKVSTKRGRKPSAATAEKPLGPSYWAPILANQTSRKSALDLGLAEGR